MQTAPDNQSQLFDEYVEDYEAACARGVGLSGESRDYFAERRVAETAHGTALPSPVQGVVDFGCGLGHSTPHLLHTFPKASVVGIDTSDGAIASSRRKYGGARVSFEVSRPGLRVGPVDLVYSNGTFHHIEPDARDAEVSCIYGWLRPGGVFALWENNPWNPGTRLVMHRIPFDRDAKTLSYLEAKRLLQRAGFLIDDVTFHFYFPSALKALRPAERYLRHLPLGGQYCVFARKPPVSS